MRNQAIKVTRDDAGVVCIAIPRKQTWWVNALAKVFYVPEEKKISLDEVGSYVWDLCDGKNDVRTIIKLFAKKYKLNRKEAELSMLTYLRQLAKKGLIGLAIRKSGGKKAKVSGRKK